METLFRDFQGGHLTGSGPLLSSTFLPFSPSNDPNRLRRLVSSSTISSIVSDLRSGFLSHQNSQVRLSKAEGQAWVDVYVAYWKAMNELVSVSERRDGSHSLIYEYWKDFANVLIKGYSASLFQAWTVPCLYVAGRYLRIFAINADKYERGAKSVNFSAGMQEDIMGAMSKNEKLEDAARVINRIFTLCLSDR